VKPGDRLPAGTTQTVLTYTGSGNYKQKNKYIIQHNGIRAHGIVLLVITHVMADKEIHEQK
jgi:hypothetical protein